MLMHTHLYALPLIYMYLHTLMSSIAAMISLNIYFTQLFSPSCWEKFKIAFLLRAFNLLQQLHFAFNFLLIAQCQSQFLILSPSFGPNN